MFFKCDTIGSPKYAYAYGEYPACKIWDCHVCDYRNIVVEKSFDIKLEGGSIYPDNLDCYFEGGLLTVSEQVLKSWIEAGITGFDAYKIGIHKDKSRARKKADPPQYYHIVINGTARLDLGYMGLKIVKECENCGHVRYDKDLIALDKIKIVKDTWDGSDIFRCDVLTKYIFVTEKILEIAHKNKFTNFEFYYEHEATYNLHDLDFNKKPKPIDLDRYFKNK